MKVFGTNDSIRPSQEKKKSTAKMESGGSVKNQPTFLELLEAIVPSDKDETREINELWQKLPDTEKKFLNEPNSYHLAEYRKLVKDILDAIMKNNTTLSMARQRGRNDKKILMSVKVIDENIQLLAMTMLNPANSAFSLLKQIEKIRGLLMDIKE